MLSNEPIILDPLFEQEEIRLNRKEDHSNWYKEKIRQLEKYVDFQAKIDQFRRTINELREAFRQRFLKVEHKRLAELAAREQELIAAAETAKAKDSTRKKSKK